MSGLSDVAWEYRLLYSLRKLSEEKKKGGGRRDKGFVPVSNHLAHT